MNLINKIIILSIYFLVDVYGEPIHQDSRCNCVCPDPSVSQATANFEFESPEERDAATSFEDRRTIYINSTVSPDECNCHTVVLIHLNLTDAQADSFCPRYVNESIFFYLST